MDRDLLLAALIAMVCGPLAWLAVPIAEGSPQHGERRAWRALMTPLAAPMVGLALLLGWAIREPDATDERLTVAGWLIAAIVVLVWVRAGVRLLRANVSRPSPPIGVVGLLRPRVVVDPEVAGSLDADALAAALAHEEAHRRHRDPLRIAVAHLAADLMWPWPQARRRVWAWRHALEEARDDEAIRAGANPDDLAAAIVAVARYHVDASGAALTGPSALERRIARLLGGDAGRVEAPARRLAGLVVATAVAAAFMLGVVAGEDLLAKIPGVVR